MLVYRIWFNCSAGPFDFQGSGEGVGTVIFVRNKLFCLSFCIIFCVTLKSFFYKATP